MEAELIDPILAIGQAIQQKIIESPREVYQLIVETTCQITGADCAVIYPYSPAFGEFYDRDNIASYGLYEETQLEERIDKRTGLKARIHLQGEIVREDIEREAPEMPKESPFIAREGINAFMGLSLQVGNNIFGIFYVDYRKAHRFSAEEKRIIRLLGQQAAMAVSNSWSFQLATIRTTAFAKLKTIGQSLLAIEDPQGTPKKLGDVLEEIAYSAQEVLDADIVDLYQYIPNRNEIVLPATLVGERRYPKISKDKIYADDVVLRAVTVGTPQYNLDAQGTELLTGDFEIVRSDVPDQRFVIREGVVSSATIPLKAAGETVGIMFVNYRTPQLFRPEQKDVIESFAAQAALAIYNARLFRMERAQRRQSEKLREVARVVNAILERDKVIDLVLDQLGQVIEYGSASVQLIQGDRRTLIGGRGFLRGDSPPQLLRNVSEDPLIQKIVQERRPLVLNNVDDEPLWDHIPETARVNSWIGIPLIVRDQVIGLLTVDHEKPGYYSQESGKVVAAFANQVATAIFNTNLFQQVSNQAQALSELNKLTQQLIAIEEAPQDTRSLLEQVARSAQQVLQADLIEFYEYWQEEKAYRLPPISAGERRGPDVPKDKVYEDDSVFRLIRRSTPLYVEQVQADLIMAGAYEIERGDRPTQRFVVREQIQSTAAIPLRTGPEVVGLMFANYRTPQDFTAGQQELIELFANQAAIAIHNSRLVEAQEGRIKALDALNQVGQELTEGIRLREQEILELIHDQASRLMSMDDMYIALYDDKTDEIRFGLAMEQGKQVAIPSRKANMKKRGKTEEVILTKKPILHKTMQESEGWYDEPEHEEFLGRIASSWMGVPMIVGEKVLGMIAVFDWARERAYDELDSQVLESMASQAAIALDNAGLYTRRVQDLKALNQVGQVLTTSLRLREEQILELVHDQASRLMSMDDMYIALYDDKTEEIRFGLAMEQGKQVTIPSRKANMKKRGKTEEVILTKKPILHKTMQESEGWYDESEHEEFLGRIQPSFMGVPMIVGEKVLGMIAVFDWARERAYDELDSQVLESMASQAAIALDNVKLVEELLGTRQLATLGTAMAAIQHRINNTLNIIPPNLSRLRKRIDLSDETIQEILDIIERNTQYTSDYVQRIQEPLKETETQAVDLNASLREAQETVWDQYQGRPGFGKVKVKYNLDDGLPLIEASSSQLAEIFCNLIENSLRAMGPQGGTLTITSRRTTDRLEAEIQDTGPGISDEIRERLFTKPVPSKKPGEGSGLGLWLSALLLQRYAGEIKIADTSPNGTTMQVRLPALRPWERV
jgi:GAF domain-containing protein